MATGTLTRPAPFRPTPANVQGGLARSFGTPQPSTVVAPPPMFADLRESGDPGGNAPASPPGGASPGSLAAAGRFGLALAPTLMSLAFPPMAPVIAGVKAGQGLLGLINAFNNPAVQDPNTFSRSLAMEATNRQGRAPFVQPDPAPPDAPTPDPTFADIANSPDANIGGMGQAAPGLSTGLGPEGEMTLSDTAAVGPQGSNEGLIGMTDADPGVDAPAPDPGYRRGGTVRRTGPARVHAGEEVVRASEARRVRPALKAINRPGAGGLERLLQRMA